MRWAGRLALSASVVLTSAGACQQDWDGPLPPPDELGAAPFPAGAVTGGLAAVYGILVAEEADGTRCHRLHRLTPDGSVESTSVCSQEPIAQVAGDEATWTGDREVGDYAFLNGTILLRVVSWDVITEELVLAESELTVCSVATRSGSRATYELVDGIAPPCS